MVEKVTLALTGLAGACAAGVAVLALAFAVPAAAQVDGRSEATALEERANRLSAAGKLTDAVPYWEQALTLRRQLGDRGGEARIVGTVAMAYFEHGDYRAAIGHFRSFAALAAELHERRAEGVAWTYLGNSLVLACEYSEAEAALRKALPVAESLHDQAGQGVILSALATAQLNLGFYAEAESSYGRLLELGGELPDAQLAGFARLGLAIIAEELGQGVRASGLYQQALNGAVKSGDLRVQGRAHGGIGNLQLKSGDYAAARASYERSLQLARTAADREGEGNAQGRLGHVYTLQGKRAEAMRAHQASLRIARERGYRQGEMEALNGIGLAEERFGGNRAAIGAYRNAYELSSQAGNRPGSVVALTNLGGALQVAGSLDESERVLREATRMADALRDEELGDLNRVSFFETQLTTYRLLGSVLRARDKPDEALEYAERGRAQALRVQMARRLKRNSGNRLLVDPASTQAMRELAIGSKATIVEYFVDEPQRRLLAWVIQPDGNIRLTSTPIELSLQDLVGATRAAVGATGLDRSARSRGISVVADAATAYAPRLRSLYSLLISPIEALLPRDPAQLVIFVPDRELFLVPFAALMDGSGSFLIDLHTVASAPSIAVLAMATRPQVRSRGIQAAEMLIVGNPSMPELQPAPGAAATRLPALPGTENEAREIGKLFGSRILLGTQATKQRVVREMTTARYVHLATHGLLDDFGTGMPGALALAPTDGDSGLLTATEISELKIGAELVVLSACDTGRGRVTGDGVVGLSRALLVAGASSTMVSLWQIPDDATAELMIGFYQNLRNRMPRAQALRAAMLAVKSHRPDPANWAAFVLSGAVR